MATITSLQHPLVKHLVKLRQNGDYRYDQHSVVIEGIKPVQEICSRIEAKVLITYDKNLLPKGLKAKETILVSEPVMKKISGMVHPEGILAELPMPDHAHFESVNSLLVLDGVADPGNLGTLLRTALSLGWQGVYIVGESCDPFNEKSLRAARGASFKLPLKRGSWEELKQLCATNKLSALLADLKGLPPEETKCPNGIMLVLSNEAHGPSQEALSFCQKVSIPISNEMESLNVAAAGAILMYVLCRGK